MNRILLTIAILTMGFVSCKENIHQDERGLSVTIKSPTIESENDINVWAYKTDGTIIGKGQTFKTFEELGNHIFDLPTGDYTIVTVIDMNKDFTVKNESSLNNLTIQLNANTEYTQNSCYGSNTVTVTNGVYTVCEVDVKRIYTAARARISNIPEGVSKIDFSVLNSANEFNPATGAYLSSREVSLSNSEGIKYEEQNGKLIGIAEFGYSKMIPPVQGENPEFKVTVTYADGEVQTKVLKSLILIEDCSMYSISIDFYDISAGYIEVGDVTVGPWNDDNSFTGDWE